MPKKSTMSKAAGKAKKPKPDAPPFPHKSGRWAKKVNQAFVYLGSIKDDPTGERAQHVWREQKHAIRAGRKPILDENAQPEGVTVRCLCDTFLEGKESLVKTGELAQRSWNDYYATCLKVADTFGRNRLVADLRPRDFADLRKALADGKGLVTLKNDMARVRILFKWGFESELLENAARFGAEFKPPSAKALRIARASKAAKLFEQTDLRRIIDVCGVALKAMVLLGVNAGLGNADCARLEHKHLDLKAGWLDFPRPKTGEPRRAKLWSETIKALKAAIAERPEPHDEAHKSLVFITKYGRPWREDKSRNSPLSHEFAKVLDELGIRQAGVGFYSLRHTLQTVAEDAGDLPALRRIMGHVAPTTDMASVYRERIDDARLVAVAEHVRKWLFPPAAKRKRKRTAK